MNGTEHRDITRGRVLLAEDAGPDRDARADLLRRAGYEVRVVADGQAALSAIAATDLDVLLTDISMPGVGGIDVLRRIRAQGIELPVLLMTGQPSSETAVEAIELGAAGYLTKPLDTDTLLSKLERAQRIHEVARIQRRLREEDDRRVTDRADLELRFARAIARIRVVFQPIVRLSDRTVLGWEAFVRSGEPSLAQPRALLDAAERLDRMFEVGREVRAVCASVWRNAPEDALLFLNLHPLELGDATLLSDESPLAPFAGRIVLEVTERACLGRVEDAFQRIADLRSRGFRLAVDDIADGYASLTTLANLEPDFLKIDRALVGEVHRSPMKQHLATAFAKLCQELGTCLVAETVETFDELRVLSQMGCDHFQGHLFARPGLPLPRPRFPVLASHMALTPGARP